MTWNVVKQLVVAWTIIMIALALVLASPSWMSPLRPAEIVVYTLTQFALISAIWAVPMIPLLILKAILK